MKQPIAGLAVVLVVVLAALLIVLQPDGDRGAPSQPPADEAPPSGKPEDVVKSGEAAEPVAQDATGDVAAGAHEAVDQLTLRLNERTAVSKLLVIASAQAMFKAMRIADEDGDGVGEYGSIAELCGLAKVRGAGRIMNPPALPPAFRELSETGVVEVNGYMFAIFLPGQGGQGLREAGKAGVTPGLLDANLAESSWVAYAWPANRGVTGVRSFAINASGILVENSQDPFSGEQGPNAEEAIRQSAGSAAAMTGDILQPDGTGVTDGWGRSDHIGALVGLLNEGARDQRASAAWQLRILGRNLEEKDCLATSLVGALADPDEEVRSAVRDTLRAVKASPEHVFQQVSELLTKTESPEVKVELLGLVATSGPAAVAAKAAVERHTHHEDEAVRKAAEAARKAISGS